MEIASLTRATYAMNHLWTTLSTAGLAGNWMALSWISFFYLHHPRSSVDGSTDKLEPAPGFNAETYCEEDLDCYTKGCQRSLHYISNSRTVWLPSRAQLLRLG